MYLQTGCEAYAEKAVAAMRIVAELYAPGGERGGGKPVFAHRHLPG